MEEDFVSYAHADTNPFNCIQMTQIDDQYCREMEVRREEGTHQLTRVAVQHFTSTLK